MGARLDLPEEAWGWMTDEIRALLRAIKPPHVAKKRRTVIKLAFARANEQPLKDVFAEDDVCSEQVWYAKWKQKPDVAAAYEACYRRALAWADESTAALEAHYRRVRRRSVAEYAAQAPSALADVMLDTGQKGADRISAANALMTWADPESAQKAQPPAPAGSSEQVVSVGVLGSLSDEELDVLIGNLRAAEDTDGG